MQQKILYQNALHPTLSLSLSFVSPYSFIYAYHTHTVATHINTHDCTHYTHHTVHTYLGLSGSHGRGLRNQILIQLVSIINRLIAYMYVYFFTDTSKIAIYSISIVNISRAATPS